MRNISILQIEFWSYMSNRLKHPIDDDDDDETFSKIQIKKNYPFHEFHFKLAIQYARVPTSFFHDVKLFTIQTK